MNLSYSKEDVKGYEFKHATYVEDLEKGKDYTLVKEVIHLKDGRKIPSLRAFHDYPVNFWVTKEGFQNHKDKKEWEEEKKLKKYTATRSTLCNAIARATGRVPNGRNDLRRLARNQYLYGCDVTNPVLLKAKYKETWPDCITNNTVAALDIETDVVKGTDDIIIIGLTFKDRAVIAYTKEFVGTEPNVERRTQEMFDKLLNSMNVPKKNKQGEMEDDFIIRKRNIKLEVLVSDTPGQACVEILKRAHEWKPDFISIYNIGFDLPIIIETMKREGFDIEKEFSDPCVPPQFRKAYFKQDTLQKVTSTGKSSSKHSADLWHVMHCTSSFTFICSMATYAKLRAAKGKEASYALDDVLYKNLKLRKLRIDQVEYQDGLEWHQTMQQHWKIEYGIYNLFDDISLELLDEKTGDLASAISGQVGVSEYARFPSIPRRTADDMHFVCRKKGLVIATTSDQMKDENDAFIVSMRDWIVTLPAHQVSSKTGIKAIRQLPNVRSQMHAHNFDIDCVSTYPTTGEVMNISKETTYAELCRIQGIDEYTQRYQGINLTGGKVNALEICSALLQYPDLKDLEAGIRRDFGLEQAA